MEGDYLLPRMASINTPLRIAVLISGSGSGLNALLNYQRISRPHITSLIVADSEDATGLEYGLKSNIKTIGIPLPHISDKHQQRLMHEELINTELIKSNIELIVLSGYMRILTPEFVVKWKGRIVNIHPSLLPKFPGANAHRDAIKAKVTVSGCTVHLVDSGVDTGHILAQKEIQVLPEDNIKTLQEKIKKIEHELYPEVLDLLSIGKYHSKSSG